MAVTSLATWGAGRFLVSLLKHSAVDRSSILGESATKPVETRPVAPEPAQAMPVAPEPVK